MSQDIRDETENPEAYACAFTHFGKEAQRMAALSEEHWQRARLFPITGIGGPAEQERRATSALLAVVEAVQELRRWIGATVGAPNAATCETYIEVPFESGTAKLRPDGLIRFAYGKRRWVALVEVKTGDNRLTTTQVEHYLDIAHAHGFDAVITVSQEIPTTPGVHPVPVSKSKIRGLRFVHLSWTQIRTQASIQHLRHAVADSDQAWLLAEYLRYLEEPKAGARQFDDMGPHWVQVRDAALHDTLVAKNAGTLAVVRGFDQLLAYAASVLARKVQGDVHPYFSDQDLEDENGRIERAATALADTKRLTGSLGVRGAIAPIGVVADLAARRVRASIVVTAPKIGRPTTRLNWLLRQLQSAPKDLTVSARVAHTKEPGEIRQLKVLRDDPKLVVSSPKSEIRAFTLTLDRPMGTKRGDGQGSFIASIVALVESFYADVVEHLKPWVAPAPKLLSSDDLDNVDIEQEVTEMPSQLEASQQSASGGGG